MSGSLKLQCIATATFLVLVTFFMSLKGVLCAMFPQKTTHSLIQAQGLRPCYMLRNDNRVTLNINTSYTWQKDINQTHTHTCSDIRSAALCWESWKPVARIKTVSHNMNQRSKHNQQFSSPILKIASMSRSFCNSEVTVHIESICLLSIYKYSNPFWATEAHGAAATLISGVTV